MKINVYKKEHIPDIKKQYRGQDGKYRSKTLYIIIYALVVLGILAIAYFSQQKPEIQYIDNTNTVVIDTTKEIIAKEKGNILDDLKECECTEKNYKEKECFNWDDGGAKKDRTSWGRYMFKISTVQLYIKGISDWDAIQLAMDYNEARELASKIIFETPNGLSNWKICTIKKNLQSRVLFVKQLQQKIDSK